MYAIFCRATYGFCNSKVRLIGLGLIRRFAGIICGGCVTRYYGEIRSYNWEIEKSVCKRRGIFRGREIWIFERGYDKNS